MDFIQFIQTLLCIQPWSLVNLSKTGQRNVVFRLCKGIPYPTLALTCHLGTAYILHGVLSAGKIRGMNCSCSSMILPSSENSSHQLHNGVIANTLRNASLKAFLLLSSAYGEELLLIHTLWKIERGPHQCFVIAEYKSKALWVVSMINCIQSTLDSVIISYLLLSTCYAVNYCCVALMFRNISNFATVIAQERNQ